MRHFLQTDRVLVYRFEPDLSGVIAVESLQSNVQSVFGHKIKDPCFTNKHLKRYKQGQSHIVNNVNTAQLATCYREVLQKFGVLANLVVPIVASKVIYGDF